MHLCVSSFPPSVPRVIMLLLESKSFTKLNNAVPFNSGKVNLLAGKLVKKLIGSLPNPPEVLS